MGGPCLHALGWGFWNRTLPAKCLLVASLQLLVACVPWASLVSWSYLEIQTGPLGSPPPPFALLVGDGQEVPSAVQVHQGPGGDRGHGQHHGPSFTGGHSIQSHSFGFQPLSRVMRDVVGGSGPVSLGVREGTSICQFPAMLRNIPTAAPNLDGPRGRISCPGSRWGQDLAQLPTLPEGE